MPILMVMSGLAVAAVPGTVVVTASDTAFPVVVDGVVEAVKQSDISSQVAASVVELLVQAGDRVGKGQVLARLDGKAAAQIAAAARLQR